MYIKLFLFLILSYNNFIQSLITTNINTNDLYSNNNIHLEHQSKRFKDFSKFCLDSQQDIIKTLNDIDGQSMFQQNPWQRYDSNNKNILEGYGITGVIENGAIIEKGGVSVTILKGKLSQERASAISARQQKNEINNNNPKPILLDNKSYFAAALSIVLHSKSPMIPTFRADIRYFEVEGESGWFGGGADLTPYYLFDNDIQSFHQYYQNKCLEYGSLAFHHKLKTWCDNYFYIPARGEHRGVGGIFFDDLQIIDDSTTLTSIENLKIKEDNNNNNNNNNNNEIKIDKAMKFTYAICNSFMPSYIPIIKSRRSLPYTEEQRHWQLLRRGRYIEFNLLYDRGVKFGMISQKKTMSYDEIQECNRRTEAVLISCPPLAAWDYNYKPLINSEEDRLMQILRNPIDWI